VTLCAYQHHHRFGELIDSEVHLNSIGNLAQSEWEQLPARFPYIELDAYIFIPDHMHGIIVIKAQREQGVIASSLGAIIGSYKSTTARLVNGILHTPGAPLWQRNYYETILRDEAHWDKTREYIFSNPIHWETDWD